MITHYKETALGYEELHKEEQLAKLRIIADNILKPGKVLDVGCGPLWSRQFFNDIIGIDPVFEGKDIIKESAELIPFADGTFDTIICVTAVHHFKLDMAIAEMKRVAKADALFVITVLKKSPKRKKIEENLEHHFNVKKVVEQHHDIIYF